MRTNAAEQVGQLGVGAWPFSLAVCVARRTMPNGYGRARQVRAFTGRRAGRRRAPESRADYEGGVAGGIEYRHRRVINSTWRCSNGGELGNHRLATQSISILKGPNQAGTQMKMRAGGSSPKYRVYTRLIVSKCFGSST
jgi:hypothetical protein